MSSCRAVSALRVHPKMPPTLDLPLLISKPTQILTQALKETFAPGVHSLQAAEVSQGWVRPGALSSGYLV